jgi:hypothetical protein
MATAFQSLEKVRPAKTHQPVAGNDNAQGKAQNRRAVIVIYNNWGKSAAK